MTLPCIRPTARWNTGASHMNNAYRAAFFVHLGLPFLIGLHRHLNRADEPPYTGPYVRWCGRGKPRGFLPPDPLVTSDSTGSFILTSLRDAGFLRRICYHSARHEAGALILSVY